MEQAPNIEGHSDFPRELFDQLITNRRSDTYVTPFRLVADAFLLADKLGVEAFSW